MSRQNDRTATGRAVILSAVALILFGAAVDLHSTWHEYFDSGDDDPPEAVSAVISDAILGSNTHGRLVKFHTGPRFVGSGVYIRENMVLTASHVVNAYPGLQVSGRDFAILADFPEFDVAIVAPDPRSPGEKKQIGPSERLLTIADAEIGEEAWLAGYAGMFTGSGPRGFLTITDGSVTSLDMDDMLVYNGGGHPGMSGSPLFNEDSELIGILSNAPLVGRSPNATMLRLAPARHIRAAVVYASAVREDAE